MLAVPSPRTWTKYVTTRSLVIGITAACALVVAACGGPQVEGTPTSAPGTTSAGAETTSPSPTKSTGLADTDPCSLLTKAEQTELGVTREPERDKVGTADTCKLRLPEFQSVLVGIRKNLGLSQVQANGGQITDTTVSGRKAKQVAGQAAGSCLIALDVSESSRVDVTTGDCSTALKVAELVEPKLPG